MKVKISFLITLIFNLGALSHSCFGQVSLRAYNYRPTGNFGFVMKPTNTLEFGYMQSFENAGDLRPNITFTVLNLKPRMDTIPTSGYISGSYEKVTPGVQAFKKYLMFQLNGGLDYALINKDKLYGYVGFQVIVGGVNAEYTVINYVTNKTFKGGELMGGCGSTLGFEYDINDNIGVFINAGRSIVLVTGELLSLNWANNYGFGINYKF